jgi:O-antigen ligase
MLFVWDIAHSTPLELASEMGIPLALLVAMAWTVALVILVRGASNRRGPKTVPLSALAVSLIALVHSCIDFSLQITGYSIVVFALLGLGLSQAFMSRKRMQTRADQNSPVQDSAQVSRVMSRVSVNLL